MARALDIGTADIPAGFLTAAGGEIPGAALAFQHEGQGRLRGFEEQLHDFQERELKRQRKMQKIGRIAGIAAALGTAGLGAPLLAAPAAGLASGIFGTGESDPLATGVGGLFEAAELGALTKKRKLLG